MLNNIEIEGRDNSALTIKLDTDQLKYLTIRELLASGREDLPEARSVLSVPTLKSTGWDSGRPSRSVLSIWVEVHSA